MSVPAELLLHPELLSTEQLIAVMQERQLRIPNLESMTRCDLLELFHHYCVPFSQRRYRDTGRGKILNRNRTINGDIAEEITRLDVTHNSYNNLKNLALNLHSERLKPPPDLLSGHIKRIKISVECEEETQAEDSPNYKRRFSINSVLSSNADSPPSKKGRKLITWP